MTNMEAMDVKNICRVCLVSGNGMHFIFQKDMTPPIDEMLTSFSKYEVCKTDSIFWGFKGLTAVYGQLPNKQYWLDHRLNFYFDFRYSEGKKEGMCNCLRKSCLRPV